MKLAYSGHSLNLGPSVMQTHSKPTVTFCRFCISVHESQPYKMTRAISSPKNFEGFCVT